MKIIIIIKMPFITFIYRIKDNPNTFYGKYICDYISDDHNGLDEEVKYVLHKSINIYREKRNLTKIKKIRIGILSFSNDEYIPTYSTDSEIKAFDFYCIYSEYKGNAVYINGKLLE